MMEDLVIYRMRIGTFRISALPKVSKRSQNMIHQLKRQRRPIKDIYFLLWLGAVWLFVWVCASTYQSPTGHDRQNKDIDINKRITNNGVVCSGSVIYYHMLFTMSYQNRNSVYEYSVHFEVLSYNNAVQSIFTFFLSLPDSSSRYTTSMFTRLCFTYVPSIIGDTVPLDCSCSSTMHMLRHLDSSPVPTMIRPIHLDAFRLLTMTRLANLELSLTPTKADESGTCYFLLGNRGAHSYHGNPGSERSPLAGTSRNQIDEKKHLHTKMVYKLSRVVKPNTDNQNIQIEWKYLMAQLIEQEVLLDAEAADVKDMFDLFKALMAKGIIDYGKYDTLKRYLSNSEGLLIKCLNIIEEFETQMTSGGEQQESKKGRKETQRQGDAAGISAETPTKKDLMHLFAQFKAELASDLQKATCRENTDVMDLMVEKWGEQDKNWYITKAMETAKEKICSDKFNFLSITGVPGSGKTTTMWHVAIFLKTSGFTVFPILHPADFEVYFDRKKKQLFIFDDVIGEYSIDNGSLAAWNRYNERLTLCLSENTKILTSIRIQLWEDQLLQGKTYIFNDELHSINLGDKEYKLGEEDMKNMLHHYLEVENIGDIERLIEDIFWKNVRQFADIFPLLCKVYSQDQAVRKHPNAFFTQPFEAMSNIFKRMKAGNKYQFCGLVLCSALELTDDFFSGFSEKELPEDKIHLRNLIIESHTLEPRKDLANIKAALESLDGVYITHVGKTFKFSHSLFQNIVTFIYDDSGFVFQYGTREFITNRVRINKRLDKDNVYVLIYNADDDIQRLVNRFIRELKSDTRRGAAFISLYPSIDDESLITCLKSQLFNNEEVPQDMIDALCWWCVRTMSHYSPSAGTPTDIKTYRGYGLLAMLLEGGADVNTELTEICLVHLPIYRNCLTITKYLLQQQNVNVNKLDIFGRSMLHYAVKNVDMTRYLLELPNLTCLNQPDIKNRTLYWHVIHNKRPILGQDRCEECHIPQETKDLYKEKGAILDYVNDC